MTRRQSPHRIYALALAAFGLGIAACSSAAAPSAPTPSPPAPTPIATLPGDPGIGGGSSGDGGTGGGLIVGPTPIDPAAGQPTIIIPKPGQKSAHPVGAMKLETSVDGRHVLVKLTWYSGVEPCSVLDSVKDARSGTDIALTLVEGSSDLGVACIDIAQLKATIVDLGDLAPGSYTIRSTIGDAVPIQLTIS